MWRTGSHGDDAAEETGITATADAGGQAVAPGGDEGGGLVVHQSANGARKTISVNADDATRNVINCAGLPSAPRIPTAAKKSFKQQKRKDTSDGTAKQSDPKRKRKEDAATTDPTSSSKKSKVGEVIESIEPMKNKREFEKFLKSKLTAGNKALTAAVKAPNPKGLPTVKDVVYGIAEKLGMEKVHEVATLLRMNDSDSVSRLTHKYIYLPVCNLQ